MAMLCPRRLTVLAAATLAAATAHAASIVPPENLGELARISDAVVLAVAGAPRPVHAGAILHTRTAFRVVEAISGPFRIGSRLVVDVLGGETATEKWVFPGSPAFEPGGVYLLPLSQRDDGVWLPQVASYGVLRRVQGRDGSTLLEPLAESGLIESFPRPDGIMPEPVETYLEGALVTHLRAVATGRARWSGAAVRASAGQLPVRVVAQTAPLGCVFLGNGRWQSGNPDPMFASNTPDASITGGGYTEVQNALGVWGAMPATSLAPSYGGQATPSLACDTDPNTFENPSNDIVVFNDPCSDIPDLQGCSGTLAQGGWGAMGQHTFDGSTWWSITLWYVVVNNGAGCIETYQPGWYTTMMAHEMGHGLGFGHTNDPNSLMYFSCCQGPDSLDVTCAQYLYPGAGPTPTPTPVGPTPTPTRTPTPGPSPTPTWTPTSGPTPTYTPTTPASPPAPPTGVAATDGAYPGKVRVTWNASATADTYQVWRNTVNDTASATYLAALAGTLYDDASVTPGVTYFYWVRAHNGAGWGGYSVPDTGFAGSGPTPTPTPPGPTPTPTPTSPGSTPTPTWTPTRTPTVPGPTPTPGGFAASFIWTPASPFVGTAVQFTDTSTGVPRSWSWAFGDGTTSTDRNPVHAWAARGTYTVTLSIGNGTATTQTSKAITVGARARKHVS